MAAKAKLTEPAQKALRLVKEWPLPVYAVGGLLKILSMGGKSKSKNPFEKQDGVVVQPIGL